MFCGRYGNVGNKQNANRLIIDVQVVVYLFLGFCFVDRWLYFVRRIRIRPCFYGDCSGSEYGFMRFSLALFETGISGNHFRIGAEYDLESRSVERSDLCFG